jgi:DNA-binding response OmpR family regulator
MLPPRAYAEPLPPFSSNVRAHASPTDSRPPLIVAVAAQDLERFPAAAYARFAARTTTEAVRLIERSRPRVIAVDWDLDEFDHSIICGAARQAAPVGILALIAEPTSAPSALKAGCHAILLKPITVNLVAARLGRLCREMPAAAAASRLGASLQQWGTNRIWPEVHCPKCNEANAVCFEYSSHRRSWYACLGCEHVWLGARRE